MIFLCAENIINFPLEDCGRELHLVDNHSSSISAPGEAVGVFQPHSGVYVGERVSTFLSIEFLLRLYYYCLYFHSAFQDTQRASLWKADLRQLGLCTVSAGLRLKPISLLLAEGMSENDPEATQQHVLSLLSQKEHTSL